MSSVRVKSGAVSPGERRSGHGVGPIAGGDVVANTCNNVVGARDRRINHRPDDRPTRSRRHARPRRIPRRTDLGGDRRRGRGRRSGSRCAGARASSTTAPRRWPASWRPSSSRRRCSTSRSAPAPAATCSAARSPRCSSARGPACSCISVVLLVQCLLFADGGITALGTNITADGRRHRAASAGWCSGCVQAVLPKRGRSVPVRRRRRRVRLRAGRGAGLRRASSRSAAHADSRSARSPRRCSACTRSSASARRVITVPGGRRPRRRPPRPRARRPPGARHARARDPHGADGGRRVRRPARRSVRSASSLVALLLAGVVELLRRRLPDGLDQGQRGPGLRRHARRSTPPATARSPATARAASTTPGSAAASPASSACWSCWCSAAGLTYAVRRRRRQPGARARPRLTMGAGHGHTLHFHGHSPVHRAPAHLKVLALLGFVLVVVATPRDWYPAFAVYLRRPRSSASPSRGCRRLPAAADGRRGAVRGVRAAAAVRRHGPAHRGARRRASASRAARGVGPARQGHARRARLPDARRDHRAAGRCSPASSGCGCPTLLVQIMGFMVRYLDVVTDELRRMRIARESRGFDARGAAALAGARRDPGRAVHPLLRARRAGAPRDAVARLHRHGCPAGDRDTPVLDVRGLAYAYPDGHQALFGVDLHVHRGERVALLGPNGAGKTTLVLHLNGILTAGRGQRRGERAAGREAAPAGDPPPGRRGVPGPRRPAVHGHRARRRRLRPGQPRPQGRRARRAG